MSYRFQLFVTGSSPLSLRAREHVSRHLAEPLGDRAEIEVIDLIADPTVARRERIVATPTLVRLEPSPVVRLIGDLTDFERVRTLVLVGGDHPLLNPGGGESGPGEAGAAPSSTERPSSSPPRS
ncbi:Circadian clock protein KaiB [Planctomycetes bacterium LzC2]|uniref:Circadian clock protein KaiB n=1 Tax=Alienimonas chondri TaxID=2681879 RepID=A0ABX1VFE8_9PLAN|nr:Circadian clock protein KaiB [Alienimonas chondri]